METETVKMNPEIKQLWLEALRSGEYRQGRGYLRRLNDDRSEGYCCLGVLCDIYAKTTKNGTWDTVYRYGTTFAVNVDSPESTDLPKSVQNWSGLTGDGVRGRLARMNDDGDHTFGDIADWIEENL